MDDKKLRISIKKYTGDTSVVSARLPVELVRSIDNIGNQTGRTRNEIIQLCLEFAVENLEIENH